LPVLLADVERTSKVLTAAPGGDSLAFRSGNAASGKSKREPNVDMAPHTRDPQSPYRDPVTLPRKSAFERYRSPVNVGLYVMPFAVLLVNGPSSHLVFRVLECLGYLSVMVGTVGRIWCGIYIAGRKSKALSVQAGIRVLGGGPPDPGREEYVFGRKSRELCTDGPYSICRNPLYLFSFLCGIGVAAQADSLWALAVFGLVF
jgi:protein-S-isoprenylcysteine O-methyltransferase Ste14